MLNPGENFKYANCCDFTPSLVLNHSTPLLEFLPGLLEWEWKNNCKTAGERLMRRVSGCCATGRESFWTGKVGLFRSFHCQFGKTLKSGKFFCGMISRQCLWESLFFLYGNVSFRTLFDLNNHYNLRFFLCQNWV